MILGNDGTIHETSPGSQVRASLKHFLAKNPQTSPLEWHTFIAGIPSSVLLGCLIKINEESSKIQLVGLIKLHIFVTYAN
jgi:hypothetical protein